MKWRNYAKSKGSMILTLALTAVFTLTACGTSNTTGTPKPTTGANSTASASPAAGSKTYKISLNTALSGAGGGFGEASKRGAEIAIDEVNKAGGVNGVKLEGIYDDNKMLPAEAAAVAKRRMDEVVATIAGPTGTIALTLMPLAKEKGIPLLAPGLATQEITNQKYENTFRVFMNDKASAASMATYLVQKMNFKKIAIIYDQNDYGVGGKNVLVKTLDGLGIKPVAVESFKGGDVDFNAQVMKAKQGEAECVVLWGLGAEISLIAKQIRSLNMNVQLAGGGGIDNTAVFVKPAGAASNNVLFVSWQLQTDNPKVKSFVEAYKGKYNADPETLSYQTYDSVMIIANALKTTGGDKAKLNEAIRNVSYDGLYGSYKFNKDGDNLIKIWVFKWMEGNVRQPVESIDPTPFY